VASLVKLLLELLLEWIRTHPNAAFSRVMLRSRGPRTVVSRMRPWERLGSALTLLLWGIVLSGVWLLLAYVTFGLKLFSADSEFVQATLFGLAILAGGGLVGGLYLLARVFI